MIQDPQEYIAQVEATETTDARVGKATWGDDFFGQRGKPRGYLFWFAILMSSISLGFLIAIVTLQALLRWKVNLAFEIINDRGLEILAVSVFGQVFGVIYIIAKALWSNDEFRLMKSKKE